MPKTDWETVPVLVPSTLLLTLAVPDDDDADSVEAVVDGAGALVAVAEASSDDAVLVDAGAMLPDWIMKLFAFALYEPSIPAYLIAAVALNGTTATTWSLTDAAAVLATGS